MASSDIGAPRGMVEQHRAAAGMEHPHKKMSTANPKFVPGRLVGGIPQPHASQRASQQFFGFSPTARTGTSTNWAKPSWYRSPTIASSTTNGAPVFLRTPADPPRGGVAGTSSTITQTLTPTSGAPAHGIVPAAGRNSVPSVVDHDPNFCLTGTAGGLHGQQDRPLGGQEQGPLGQQADLPPHQLGSSAAQQARRGSTSGVARSVAVMTTTKLMMASTPNLGDVDGGGPLPNRWSGFSDSTGSPELERFKSNKSAVIVAGGGPRSAVRQLFHFGGGGAGITTAEVEAAGSTGVPPVLLPGQDGSSFQSGTGATQQGATGATVVSSSGASTTMFPCQQKTFLRTTPPALGVPKLNATRRGAGAPPPSAYTRSSWNTSSNNIFRPAAVLGASDRRGGVVVHDGVVQRSGAPAPWTTTPQRSRTPTLAGGAGVPPTAASRNLTPAPVVAPPEGVVGNGNAGIDVVPQQLGQQNAGVFSAGAPPIAAGPSPTASRSPVERVVGTVPTAVPMIKNFNAIAANAARASPRAGGQRSAQRSSVKPSPASRDPSATRSLLGQSTTTTPLHIGIRPPPRITNFAGKLSSRAPSLGPPAAPGSVGGSSAHNSARASPTGSSVSQTVQSLSGSRRLNHPTTTAQWNTASRPQLLTTGAFFQGNPLGQPRAAPTGLLHQQQQTRVTQQVQKKITQQQVPTNVSRQAARQTETDHTTPTSNGDPLVGGAPHQLSAFQNIMRTKPSVLGGFTFQTRKRVLCSPTRRGLPQALGQASPRRGAQQGGVPQQGGGGPTSKSPYVPMPDLDDPIMPGRPDDVVDRELDNDLVREQQLQRGGEQQLQRGGEQQAPVFRDHRSSTIRRRESGKPVFVGDGGGGRGAPPSPPADLQRAQQFVRATPERGEKDAPPIEGNKPPVTFEMPTLASPNFCEEEAVFAARLSKRVSDRVKAAPAIVLKHGTTSGSGLREHQFVPGQTGRSSFLFGKKPSPRNSNSSGKKPSPVPKARTSARTSGTTSAERGRNSSGKKPSPREALEFVTAIAGPGKKKPPVSSSSPCGAAGAAGKPQTSAAAQTTSKTAASQRTSLLFSCSKTSSSPRPPPETAETSSSLKRNAAREAVGFGAQMRKEDLLEELNEPIQSPPICPAVDRSADSCGSANKLLAMAASPENCENELAQFREEVSFWMNFWSHVDRTGCRVVGPRPEERPGAAPHDPLAASETSTNYEDTGANRTTPAAGPLTDADDQKQLAAELLADEIEVPQIALAEILLSATNFPKGGSYATAEIPVCSPSPRSTPPPSPPPPPFNSSALPLSSHSSPPPSVVPSLGQHHDPSLGTDLATARDILLMRALSASRLSGVGQIDRSTGSLLGTGGDSMDGVGPAGSPQAYGTPVLEQEVSMST